MEKNLSIRIIYTLSKKESHARAIAKELKTNHTTVNNKLKQLVNNNVLDFRTEGKNKVYFLKNTIESRNQVMIMELNRSNWTVERYPRLRRIMNAIQKDNRIKIAIIFGSYAKGTANKKSDIDIFIAPWKKDIRRDLKMLDSDLSIKMGEFDGTNPLVQEIIKDHVVIKGVERFQEQIKVFEKDVP